ncbi:zinc finger protein 182-like isoform X3 [Ambystoma mexicanum]|uniref:zinc finger protein 182-like isoform X3 n=1 Tax=Ambystoma mexicanum TaxID=8296 RepID=UPI0037E9A28B
MTKKCVVGGCSNTNLDKVSLHHWPKDYPLRHKWDNFVASTRKDWVAGSKNSVICCQHFEAPVDFANYYQWACGFKRKLNLVPDAYPKKTSKHPVATRVEGGQTADMATTLEFQREVAEEDVQMKNEDESHYDSEDGKMLETSADDQGIEPEVISHTCIKEDDPISPEHQSSERREELEMDSGEEKEDVLFIIKEEDEQYPAQEGFGRGEQLKHDSGKEKEDVSFIVKEEDEQDPEQEGFGRGEQLKHDSETEFPVHSFTIKEEKDTWPVDEDSKKKESFTKSTGEENEDASFIIKEDDEQYPEQEGFVRGESLKHDSDSGLMDMKTNGDLTFSERMTTCKSPSKKITVIVPQISDKEDLDGMMSWSEVNQKSNERKSTHCDSGFEDTAHINLHGQVAKIMSYKGDETEKPLKNRLQRENLADQTYQYVQCKKTFFSTGTFKDHVCVHALAKPLTAVSEDMNPEIEQSFNCNRCDKKFTKKGQLTIHQKKHTGVHLYPCTECGKGFSQKAFMTRHLRTHTGEKPFQCTDCKKCFRYKASLVMHQRNHTGETPYQCTECSKSFSRKRYLIIHEKSHKGELPYKCAVCEKTFNVKGNLIIHERIHTGERPFQCTMCEKRFGHKNCLIIHERTHTGETPFQCTKCEKRFSYKSSLITHERTHTGERPYQCTICNKKFTFKGYLKIHTRTHTGEKPYQCPKCEKNFSFKSSLVEHERTHSGERSFQCSECTKTFAFHGHLEMHMRTHTRQKPYPCNECEKCFNDRRKLENHQRLHLQIMRLNAMKAIRHLWQNNVPDDQMVLPSPDKT